MPSHSARYLLQIQGLTEEVRVVRFAGHEGISELYRFDVALVCDDSALPLDRVVGGEAVLTIQSADEPERHFHGIIARFELEDVGKRSASYRATIVPRMHSLLYRYDCRIFQEKTTPDIIEAVLKGAGASNYTMSLRGTYERREYCVQYRESDFAFISRLMEEEGIFYYFSHESDSHNLHICDGASSHEPIQGRHSIVYRVAGGAVARTEHVSRFTVANTMGSGKVTLRDFNFKMPSTLLAADQTGSVFGDLEAYDYPGDFETVPRGTELTVLRLDEHKSHYRTAAGESSCVRFVAGATFQLNEHPQDALNDEYILVRVEHRGVEPGIGDEGAGGETVYENRFECIQASVVYRPPIRTPKPTVKGVQSAIVVGPSGEEIYTDQHGRIKVQFHWDRLGKKDDNSSCFIRVSQLWAGEAWGGMHIPRINQEVLVDFLEGDPDRPVVVGRLYHATNVPPYALPANKTRSTIKSNSTPGGGGFNELRFEDKAGSEEIYIHAQKDTLIEILNDKNQTVGHDETLDVTHDRSLTIGNDMTVAVKHDETLDVTNDRKRSVGHDETVNIGNDRTLGVGNDLTESVGNNLTISVAKARAEEVGEDASLTVGKKLTIGVGTDLGIDAKGGMDVQIGGDQKEDIKLEKKLTVGSKITIECGSAKVTIEKSGKITIEGSELDVKASGAVKVEAATIEAKASSSATVESSGTITVKSSGQMDINASGPVKLKGSAVGIN